MFNTPVHERLFADHENRTKRVQTLMHNEAEKMRTSYTMKAYDQVARPPTMSSHMNSYRSVGTLPGRTSNSA